MDARHHNWDAVDYARNSSQQLLWARELIAKLSLKGGESILDIGCGDGKITAELAGRLPCGSVVGVDASSSMIDLARATFPATIYSNLSFQQMDAAHLKLTEKFDVAFSNATFHWIQDHQAVLRSTRQTLRTGGKLFIQMGGKGNAGEMFTIFRDMLLDPTWRDYFTGFLPPYHFLGVEEYKAWLPECGFAPKRIELISKDMRHEGLDQLKGWLRTTWFPYTDRLPDDLKGKFLDQAVEAFIREHPVDNQGRTHMKMVRLEVEAFSC